MKYLKTLQQIFKNRWERLIILKKTFYQIKKNKKHKSIYFNNK